MASRTRSHLSDHSLLLALAEHLARERGTCAEVLADLAEVDVRRLYLPAGFPSLFAYCTDQLRFSKDAAFKRIRAARAGRRFPVLLDRIAEGRLCLSAVVMLAVHLTEDNAAELIAAADGQTREHVELLLAARFPRPDLPTRIEAVLPTGRPGAVALGIDSQLAPGPVGMTRSGQDAETDHTTGLDPATITGSAPELVGAHALGIDSQLAVRPVEPATHTRVEPRSAERFAIQVTVPKSTHDALRRAQELLRHQLPNGDVATVLDRALNLLVRELEKRKFAATDRPRACGRRESGNPRRIPAEVRRAVVDRDGARCTFVGVRGRRCEARDRLEFDHIEPVGRGGRATVGNLRLRCRAHNQFEAERTYGTEFMRHKREAAHEAAPARRRE